MPRFKAVLMSFNADGEPSTDDVAYTETGVYCMDEIFHYCSPQKLRHVEFINATGLDPEGDYESSDSTLMDMGHVDALPGVERDFEDMDEAREYWQGNWPF